MQKIIKCIIIDDEPLARRGIEILIKRVPFLEFRASCANPLEALEELRSGDIDLMFLDIQMPEMSGIEMLENIQGLPMTIFTTAYPDHALKSYELNAIDYLLKPISADRFHKAVNKARDNFNLKHQSGAEPAKFMFIKCENRFVKVEFSDILFIGAMGNYVVIQLTGEKLIAYLTMKNMEEVLPADMFVRTSKSHLIAIEKINSITGNEVKVDKYSFTISRVYREAALHKLFASTIIRRK